MGGTKRKIVSMEKIKAKDSRAVTFSKRRKGLYSKTSELCLLSGAQVAILATPLSSNSKSSFFSFGHSSVDSVVSAFLSDQRPPPYENVSSVTNKKGLGFWWEDESLLESENSEDLSDAVDAISSILKNLKGLHSKAVKNQEGLKNKKKKKKKEEDHNQTLNKTLSLCSQDYQTLAAFDKNNNNNDGDLYRKKLDQSESVVISYESPFICFGSESSETGPMVIQSNPDEDKIVESSDNINNNDLYVCNSQEVLDYDELFDFVSSSECLSMNLEIDDVSDAMTKTYQDAEAVEDGQMVVIQKDLDEDNLHFSDVFNELTSITAL